MTRGSQSKGACMFCGKETKRAGMTRHLQSCPEWRAAVEIANQRVGRVLPIYQLHVQDAWEGIYWLQLEMKGTATLGDLDDYL